MLINIINNAIDALSLCDKDDKVIKLNFITEDELCMLTITDNGIGINKKDLFKIFRLFYTTKSYTTNNGIGLNYVKNVVAMHKGEIRINSKPDKYTSVQIVFPIAKTKAKKKGK